ncbi:MAG TPA: hypothetical protein VHP37_30605 [Burkholderiales bacterium]|nr:hypothetical protein [Burkholderiales bacterium]
MLFVLAALSAVGARAQTFDVPPELWDRPRTARAVLDQENVRRAVAAALAKPEARIVIHHGPGQEPLVQAEELRSWLAALAIDSRRTVLRADAAPGASITLEITP